MDINARQIDALDFNYLDQQDTYQYSIDQLARVKSNQAIMAKLSAEVTAWENATVAFNEAYRKVSTAQQTKAVEKLDGERDSLYNGFTGTVSNALKSPIPGQQEAAEGLMEPIKRYKVNSGGEYQSQTMRTDQLCTDLLENFATQLATLNLTAWVEALQAKNQEFNEAMFARTNAQAGYIPAELTQLRQQMIVGYRKFVKLMNVVLIYEGDTAYAETIDQLNAEVLHYKRIIARKSPSSSSQSGQGGGSSQEGGSQQGGSQQGGSEEGGSGDDSGTTPPSGGGGFPGSEEVDGQSGGSGDDSGTTPPSGGGGFPGSDEIDDQGGGSGDDSGTTPPSGGGGFGG